MTNIYNGSTINRKCFVAKGYKKKNYIVPLKSKWSGKQENGRKYVKNASMSLKIIK